MTAGLRLDVRNSFTPRYGVKKTATIHDTMRAKATIQKMLPAYSPAVERAKPTGVNPIRDQCAGQHRRGRVTPGVRRRFRPFDALFELHHHHFDRDDRVIDEQAEREDERSQVMRSKTRSVEA